MGIIEALNRASMYLLLDNETEWENSNNNITAFKEENITMGGSIYILSRYANKVNFNKDTDFYYFDSILKYSDGRVIITNELKLKVSHNELLINEVLSYKELLEFIEINACEDQNSYWFANHNYDKLLINYVEELYDIKKDVKLVK